MYEVISPRNSGRVIAVWSPVSRQGAVSTTAALVSTYIGKTNPNDKILILSNETRGLPNAAYYMSRGDTQQGLAEVVELAISDNLNKVDDLYNNAFTLAPNIDVLGSTKFNTNVESYLPISINKILELAKRAYRYIIVDTVCGQEDETTNQVLDLSDVVVVGIPHDRYTFDNWVRKMPDVFPQRLQKHYNKLVLVCSIYYNYIHLEYHDMVRALKGRKLYYINQNSLVHKLVGTRRMYETIESEIDKFKVKAGKCDTVVNEVAAIVEDIYRIIESVIETEEQEEIKMDQEVQAKNDEYMEEFSSYFESPDFYADEDRYIPPETEDDSNNTSDETEGSTEVEAYEDAEESEEDENKDNKKNYDNDEGKSSEYDSDLETQEDDQESSMEDDGEAQDNDDPQKEDATFFDFGDEDYK